MSAPTLYYEIEESTLDTITGNRVTTTLSGGDTLPEVTDLINAAYTFIQAGAATDTRSMTVKLNAAVVAAPAAALAAPSESR